MSAPLEIFRALADPTRLRIITLLRSMELSVGELAQVLGQSQPRVSRHVKILVDAGLVDRRKEGAWVFIAKRSSARPARLGLPWSKALMNDQGSVRLEKKLAMPERAGLGVIAR